MIKKIFLYNTQDIMNNKILAILLVVSISILFVFLYNKDISHERSEKKEKKQFIPSSTFKGKKNGYVFKTEDNKTGYYIDVANSRNIKQV